MEEELSRQAQEALREFGEALEPPTGAQQKTWSRLEEQIRHENAATLAAARRRQRRRGAARRLWLVLRPAVITTALVSALYIGWEIAKRSEGEALLNDARVLLDLGEHAQAYAVLVQHSRSRNTKSAAEKRMGLVLDALCGLGKRDRAQLALERYLIKNPDSIHAGRLDYLCGVGPAKPPPEPPIPDGPTCNPDEPVCEPEDTYLLEPEQGDVVKPGKPAEQPWFSTATPGKDPGK
jgi:tetratricopeptide (TPR) repeat protein